jgi:hypothetical protein
MDRLVADGRLRDWAPHAFRAFAAEAPLHAIGTRGYPWIEIDFPEDYQRAVREILPAIEADGSLGADNYRTMPAVLSAVRPDPESIAGGALGADDLR